MNRIKKDFKLKSKLRGLADGGQPPPIGNGMAQQAAGAIRDRRSRIDDIVDAASAGQPPPQQQPAPVKKPEEKSALRSFFGLADGGAPSARKLLDEEIGYAPE